MKDLKGCLEAFDSAAEIASCSESEVLALLEDLSRIRRRINESFVLRQGHDVDRDLGRWTAQSQIFVADCVPYVLESLRENHRRRDSATLLDVGTATGAGTALLSTLLSTDMLWCPVQVTGIDLFPHRVICAKNNFADFEYVVSDVFEHDRRYDYVFSSHTLEHVPEPRPFIDRLVELARHDVFLYTPYAEDDLIPGHCSRITEDFYEGWEVKRFERIKSAGWHWGKPDTDYCLLAILKGGAASSTTEPATGASK